MSTSNFYRNDRVRMFKCNNVIIKNQGSVTKNKNCSIILFFKRWVSAKGTLAPEKACSNGKGLDCMQETSVLDPDVPYFISWLCDLE